MASRPMSFSVFIARKSGNRLPLPPGRRSVPAMLLSVIHVLKLAVAKSVRSTPELELAQLALRRCLYLCRELGRLRYQAPDAALMVARCIIETALVGSYLAIHGTGSAQRLMKKQSKSAQRLRERFLSGDTLGALALLSEVDFVAEPLSSTLASVKQFRPLDQVCCELDKYPPFSNGKLATLIYEETYALLSNQVEHPTPQSLRRHRSSHLRLLGRGPKLFRPKVLLPYGETIDLVIIPAVGALCSCLARAVDQPYVIFDRIAFESASADGYLWTGSPARMVAAAGLADLVGLSSLGALNRYGMVVRMVAALDAMLEMTEFEQLLVACEILDRSRKVSRLLNLFLPGVWPINMLHRPLSVDCAPLIARGKAVDSPQALMAALALVYAGLWRDDPKVLAATLEAFDASAPHRSNLLRPLLQKTGPSDLKHLRERHRSQVINMP